MLKLLRLLVLALAMIVVFVLGTLLCLLRPRHPNNVYLLGRLFHKACPLVGLKIRIRGLEHVAGLESAVYIANHQSNWDIIVHPGVVMPRTVAIGKKALFWIPLFGQLFWLSGNLLINRENKAKAAGTIGTVVDKIRHNRMSIWMFPEGTRSQGKGLLPFKTGAFHIALQARVPIVPIACSSYFGQVDLNRWDNGEVLIDIMPPIDIEPYEPAQLRELLKHSRQLIAERIEALDKEARRP
ncbi:1-acyl-sn-glycerol-3-phosphate acyltransferase [Zobellella denitrificans]|jgi:1-acyl-sn-glycerol-3-phosphate acyltransferase|uniref:1-acyl-sn-glycerol-3-phosphate acyltransferase n=1 Tax=Zobellella denitrificans TaxID=347534 RepID=A0A231MXA7_9GAMM|nr:1-acylglycerol-3-phosphate O-acyltransferase [Zobellella denitrificans]ATG75208.1 acyl-phosphate glycerol 3-phosphate acyltransferase [Zobellella denitrificans]OXS14679.1 1-acyl-sn-glycerol-3-phosphate acyltransferase [Zobellella denitrificans]